MREVRDVGKTKRETYSEYVDRFVGAPQQRNSPFSWNRLLRCSFVEIIFGRCYGERTILLHFLLNLLEYVL